MPRCVGRSAGLLTIASHGRRAGVGEGNQAALEEAAERLRGALLDHGCRGTFACEGHPGAIKVRALPAHAARVAAVCSVLVLRTGLARRACGSF